jgi:hypothetical protein
MKYTLERKESDHWNFLFFQYQFLKGYCQMLPIKIIIIKIKDVDLWAVYSFT